MIYRYYGFKKKNHLFLSNIVKQLVLGISCIYIFSISHSKPKRNGQTKHYTQIPVEYRVNAALKRGGVSYAMLKGGEKVKREFKCAECGAACDMSQMYTVGGKNICATCADEKTFVCEDCGGRFWWVEDKSETLCVPCYCVRRERED